MARDKDYIRLINNSRWRRLRTAYLERHPLCEDCRAMGRVRSAREVHHVRPVESGATFADKQQLAYDADNLRALCHACHVAAHTRMGRGSLRQARERHRQERAAALGRLFGTTPGGCFLKTPGEAETQCRPFVNAREKK